MTKESAVKVCVRVRPHVEREEGGLLEDTEPVQLCWMAGNGSVRRIDDGDSKGNFSFGRVFSAGEATSQLYQTVAGPLVVSAVEGYGGTIFACGQTSSGKTFTMMGCDRIPGVIPLAVEDVFQTIKNFPNKEFLLRVSYMEIYNETVTDLLVDSWKGKPLEVRETINKNIYVADLTEELVTSPAQALAWIRKGEKNRHYGKTKMNQRSSRSHTIFRMILESLEKSDPTSGENADEAIIVSHLNLVDLAGSERASQTGAEGARFKERYNINRSLFILGQVIKKLTDESQKGFINYRDSKLTRILQNSLGGNAKTLIICTISPSTLDETLSTLQFASTAKKMKNNPHVTEVSDEGALLKRYRNEIEDLKRRLHEVSSVTQTTATEKEVLSQLLQEKDQLQREQEERIKNLTRLLVTGSNLDPVQKRSKRRVTWGGKILRRATPSSCDDMSDLGVVDPFSLRRKANSSCLMEQTGDEYFDSHWVISEEPSDDMEMSRSSVTVRSFGDSSRDFLFPERMCELSQKVSELELQFEMESQQKEEAMENVEALDGEVADPQLKLQTEAQEKLDNIKRLESRLAGLERQLEEQSCIETEQIKRELAETIQLCETLASEKEIVVAERDYLKQELGMFIEQTKNLEQEKSALSQEPKERRDSEEFKSLEEEFAKEHESELKNEISNLRTAHDSSELRCQEFQALHVQFQELEEARTKANRESIHKQATLIEQKEATIQTLKSSLHDSKIQASSSAAEMEKVKTQLLMMEMKLSSASHEHEQEKRRMATLVREKEESLRKLKETLRRLHQQGEESFLQGKEVHARLTNPGGVMTESSILLEKTKLEEEVKQLQLKIIELESLVSSQQTEIHKWKNRAINLKIKSEAEVDKPSSPHPPTKRGLAMTSDSFNLHSPPKKFPFPKKILDSHKKVLAAPVKLLNYSKVPLLCSKNTFFDLGGSSEVLSRTCPKPVCDDSRLGIIPDEAVGADPKEELWPLSPKQEEMCTSQ